MYKLLKVADDLVVDCSVIESIEMHHNGSYVADYDDPVGIGWTLVDGSFVDLRDPTQPEIIDQEST